MKKSITYLNPRKIQFLVLFSFVNTSFVFNVSPMEHRIVTQQSGQVSKKQGIQNRILSRSWLSTHGPALVASGTVCGIIHQYFAQEHLAAIFSQHAFAERISHALRDINYQIKWDKKISSGGANFVCLTVKLGNIMVFWLLIALLETYAIPDAHWGFGEVVALALMYTTAEHFTDEKHEFRKEFNHELNHVLHDPKHTAELTSKVIETQLTRPTLLAGQLYDEKVAEGLRRIQENPRLSQKFQQTYEAQQAMLMRMVIEQTLSSIKTQQIQWPSSPDKGAGAAGGGDGSQSIEKNPEEMKREYDEFAKLMQIKYPEIVQAFDELKNGDFFLQLYGQIPAWHPVKYSFSNQGDRSDAFMEKLVQNTAFFLQLLCPSYKGKVLEDPSFEYERRVFENNKELLRALLDNAHCRYQFKKIHKGQGLELAKLANLIAIHQQAGITFANDEKLRKENQRYLLAKGVTAVNSFFDCCGKEPGVTQAPRGEMVNAVFRGVAPKKKVSSGRCWPCGSKNKIADDSSDPENPNPPDKGGDGTNSAAALLTDSTGTPPVTPTNQAAIVPPSAAAADGGTQDYPSTGQPGLHETPQDTTDQSTASARVPAITSGDGAPNGLGSDNMGVGRSVDERSDAAAADAHPTNIESGAVSGSEEESTSIVRVQGSGGNVSP